MKKTLKYISISLLMILLTLTTTGCYFFSNDIEIKNLPFNLNQNSFKWGVGINPYPNGRHSPEVLDQVFKNAETLGIKWFRFEVPKDETELATIYDPLAAESMKRGFNLVAIIQPTPDYQGLKDPYQAGYDYAYKIASSYPQINYFQLGNEPAASAIKLNWSGATEEAYYMDKYQKIFYWLKGASAGVKKANFQAKRIITGHWLTTAFFDLLKRDNLDYDIIGWDWFDEKSDIFNLQENGQKFDLFAKLSSFDKEIWITEAGMRAGDSEEAKLKQAKYLEDFFTNIPQGVKISGFFLLVFIDQVHQWDTPSAYDGVVGLKKDANNLWQIGDPKPAFFSYQKIIENFSGE